MTTPQDLTFSLAAFDHRRACAQLTRRLLPAWPRVSPTLALLTILALFILTRMLPPAALVFPIWLPLLLLAMTFAFYRMCLSMRRHRVWSAVQQAPLRQGTQSVRHSERGLRFSGPGWTLDLDGSAIHDVIETPEGLLILLGDMDYQPIPASAFTDPAAQSAFAAARRARLASV
jgi:hypothetical protein